MVGFGEAEKLDDVILDIDRIGDYTPDIEAQDLLQRGLPVAHERFAGGDGGFSVGDAHWQDAVALGIGRGHEFGDRREVDLERIDMQIGHADLAGHPLGELLKVQQFARVARVFEFLCVEDDQRMLLAVIQAAVGQQAFRILRRHQTIADQVTQHRFERDAASGRDGGELAGVRFCCGHGFGHRRNINVSF